LLGRAFQISRQRPVAEGQGQVRAITADHRRRVFHQNPVALFALFDLFGGEGRFGDVQPQADGFDRQAQVVAQQLGFIEQPVVFAALSRSRKRRAPSLRAAVGGYGRNTDRGLQDESIATSSRGAIGGVQPSSGCRLALKKSVAARPRRNAAHKSPLANWRSGCPVARGGFGSLLLVPMSLMSSMKPTRRRCSPTAGPDLARDTTRRLS
jgi:hypothetical protein